MTEKQFDTPQQENRALQRKLQLLQNPYSIVFLPRTREGILLVTIWFSFDRAVNRLRMGLMSREQLLVLNSSLININNFIQKFRNFVTSLDGHQNTSEVFLDFEFKNLLAQRRNSFVLLPRSAEGRDLLQVFLQIDPALVRLKNTSTDFEGVQVVFTKLRDLIPQFDNLTNNLCSTVSIEYRRPRRIEALDYFSLVRFYFL